MRLHGNARLTPSGRLLLCTRVIEERWTVAEATSRPDNAALGGASGE